MITHILLKWREIRVAQAPNIFHHQNTTKCLSREILSRSQLTCRKITLALPPAMTIRSPQGFMTKETGKKILQHVFSFTYLKIRFSSSLLSGSHAPKAFWDACFYAKMAADLFFFRVCGLLASFLVLTSGQSNRTVFLPSSTSGNSRIVVLGWCLKITRELWHDLQSWFSVIFVIFASECY